MNENILKVWAQYDLGEISEVKKISGGLINQTFLVTNKIGSKYILQKLQKIFDKNLMEDFDIISKHLANLDWIGPTLLYSENNEKYVVLKSEIWRAYKYIDAVSFSSKIIKRNIYREVGHLLGALHKSLASLDYSPLHRLEGFHEKDFYIGKAVNIEKNSYSKDLKFILDKVISNLQKYSKNLQNFRQVIHGDPRVENILFSLEGNKPYTFIDYDTFMFASIYIDIGDCLRSLMLLEEETSCLEKISQFIEGYQGGNSKVGLSYDDALSALKYVTLELTLRFMIDSVEQCYFSWEPNLYKNSAEHNEVRAKQHWNLFKKLDEEL